MVGAGGRGNFVGFPFNDLLAMWSLSAYVYRRKNYKWRRAALRSSLL